MQAFFVSLWTVTLAEMGDRTQLLSLMLVTRYRRPWPVLAGVLCAAAASHALAAFLGAQIGARLNTALVDAAVGASMILMALWMLRPEREGEQGRIDSHRGVFTTTLLTFLVAEIGDKTQIATLALAAGYHNLFAVIAGSTCGMMLANAPVIFIGRLFAEKLPMRAIHMVTVVLLLLIGGLFLYRAVRHG